MTINEYSERVKRLDLNQLTIEALKNNEKIIIDALKSSWDVSKNPSGEEFKSKWLGQDVKDMEYRKTHGIRNMVYNYKKINISGETRKNMKISDTAMLYSETSYWKNIKDRFALDNDDLTDFSGVKKSDTTKSRTNTALIILIKNKLKNGN